MAHSWPLLIPTLSVPGGAGTGGNAGAAGGAGLLIVDEYYNQ